MANGPTMDASRDRSFGGVSFVTRTDRKSKSGVVLLRLADGEREGVLTARMKKFVLKVDKQNLGIFSKDGKTMLQTFPIELCSFGVANEPHAIDAICPGMRFIIKTNGADTSSWMLALQTNSKRTGLTGARNEGTGGRSPVRKDSLGFELDGPPKPHLMNRRAMEVNVSKPKGASMGMKVCGGGGPDGDPQRPEIFVFSLEPGGVAAKAGLTRGDIVISVDKVALTGMHVSQAAKELSKAGGQQVLLRVLRKVKRHATKAGAGPSPLSAIPNGHTNGHSNGHQPSSSSSSPPAKKGGLNTNAGLYSGRSAHALAADPSPATTTTTTTRPTAPSQPSSQPTITSTNNKNNDDDEEEETEDSFGFEAVDGPEDNFGFGGIMTDDEFESSDDGGAASSPQPPAKVSHPTSRTPSPPPPAPTTNKPTPKRAAPAPPQPATTSPAPSSPPSEDTETAAPKQQGNSERAARLAKLRAARQSKKDDWMKDLDASLKIIDDLEE
eukprot:m.174354 g.174354  ORF g.174354 m.174354 type:complete len:496 (+) comp13821_c0_seq1:208-1695(+)